MRNYSTVDLRVMAARCDDRAAMLAGHPNLKANLIKLGLLLYELADLRDLINRERLNADYAHRSSYKH